MTVIQEYLAPRTLEELTRLVGDGEAAIYAGGTDLGPRWNKDVVEKPATVIDVKAIAELHGVRVDGEEVVIGACTLMSQIEADPMLRKSAGALAPAAGRVACPQIRNRATIGGNLCNASPAADTAVPLILLDAEVELASVGDDGVVRRRVPITEFFTGPGSTCRKPGEVLTCVRFKPLPDTTSCAWDKFGTRPAMEIAVASVGVMLEQADGVVKRARVGYGSVAPTPLRGHKAEAELAGKRLTAEVIERVTAAARDEINPISDVRAGAEYRRTVIGVMLGRMLNDAAGA